MVVFKASARVAPSDVRLDVFRRVTPPYDMTQLSPSGYQYSPPMSGNYAMLLNVNAYKCGFTSTRY